MCLLNEVNDWMLARSVYARVSNAKTARTSKEPKAPTRTPIKCIFVPLSCFCSVCDAAVYRWLLVFCGYCLTVFSPKKCDPYLHTTHCTHILLYLMSVLHTPSPLYLYSTT